MSQRRGCAKGTASVLHALDRLIAIQGSFSGIYVYDPLGRRIARTELGVTTRYQYDGLDVVAEYSASSTTVQARYVFGPGIDEPLKAKRGVTVAAYHSDGLGSVRLLSEVGGAAGDLATYTYDAFGEDQGSPSIFANAYTFTGRERDASGLLYYRARYYLPRAGRFLTPDPLGLAGGSNPYVYAASNPVNFTDPFGLTPVHAKRSLGNDTSPLYFPALSKSSTASGSYYSPNTLLGSSYNAGSGSGVSNLGGAPASQSWQQSILQGIGFGIDSAELGRFEVGLADFQRQIASPLNAYASLEAIAHPILVPAFVTGTGLATIGVGAFVAFTLPVSAPVAAFTLGSTLLIGSGVTAVGLDLGATQINETFGTALYTSGRLPPIHHHRPP